MINVAYIQKVDRLFNKINSRLLTNDRFTPWDSYAFASNAPVAEMFHVSAEVDDLLIEITRGRYHD